MHRMLTSPVYGGAYTYGKTEHLIGYEGAKPRHLCQRKPMEQWMALIPGAQDGYVSWEEFQRIESAIRENTQGVQRRAAPKNGHPQLARTLSGLRTRRKPSVHEQRSTKDEL